MRIIATHNGHTVVIVAFLFEGENLKAIYIDSEGKIDEDNASNFTVEPSDVEKMQELKVKSW